MSTNKRQSAIIALYGISAVICAVTAAFTAASGDYGVAALMLCTMSLMIIAMGVFVNRDAPECSEKTAEITLE